MRPSDRRRLQRIEATLAAPTPPSRAEAPTRLLIAIYQDLLAHLEHTDQLPPTPPGCAHQHRHQPCTRCRPWHTAALQAAHNCIPPNTTTYAFADLYLSTARLLRWPLTPQVQQILSERPQH
jgi:hypothetical protein